MNNRRFYDTRRAQTQRPAAAALAYDPLGNEPPEIVAAGSGLTAERIVALARENNVPLHQDAGLVEALARLEVGTLIPRELYTVVAEVLAFVYAVDAEAGAPLTMRPFRARRTQRTAGALLPVLNTIPS